jgi:hypothetical protein
MIKGALLHASLPSIQPVFAFNEMIAFLKCLGFNRSERPSNALPALVLPAGYTTIRAWAAALEALELNETAFAQLDAELVSSLKEDKTARLNLVRSFKVAAIEHRSMSS